MKFLIQLNYTHSISIYQTIHSYCRKCKNLRSLKKNFKYQQSNYLSEALLIISFTPSECLKSQSNKQRVQGNQNQQSINKTKQRCSYIYNIPPKEEKLIEFYYVIVFYCTKKNGHCIAKAIQIIGVQRFQQYTPIIQVQWYYTKKDLKQIIGQHLDCISQRELFLSDQYDYIQPDIIVGEAQVLELEQFEQKNFSTGFVFFSRSFYKNQQIIPPIQKWEKHCKCRQPINPDRKYVICDICQQRYHQECMTLNNNLQGIYVCPSCKKQK